MRPRQTHIEVLHPLRQHPLKELDVRKPWHYWTQWLLAYDVGQSCCGKQPQQNHSCRDPGRPAMLSLSYSLYWLTNGFYIDYRYIDRANILIRISNDRSDLWSNSFQSGYAYILYIVRAKDGITQSILSILGVSPNPGIDETRFCVYMCRRNGFVKVKYYSLVLAGLDKASQTKK